MKIEHVILLTISFLIVAGAASLVKETSFPKNTIDPNFKIVQVKDEKIPNINRKVEVFGLKIIAVKGVEDNKLLHAANILAQYLDNDEDGIVDNQEVLSSLINKKATLLMWKNESDLEDIELESQFTQDLGNDETRPFWHTLRSSNFDASLEEIWHLITHVGYSSAYPKVFKEEKDSLLSKAMDKARGGYFEDIPSSYPKEAWYSYYDKTCDYSCMITEYFYWSMTSYLGAQKNRLNEIQDEWKLNTKEKLERKDILISKLLTNPLYKLPKVLPDGTYKR